MILTTWWSRPFEKIEATYFSDARLWQKILLFRLLRCPWGFNVCKNENMTWKLAPRNRWCQFVEKLHSSLLEELYVVYNEKQWGSRDGCGLLLVWYTGDSCLLIFKFYYLTHFLFRSSTAKLIGDFCINRCRASNNSFSLIMRQYYWRKKHFMPVAKERQTRKNY